MKIVTLRVKGFECERCRYRWIPRDIAKPPKVCPNGECKSPYWNRPRKTRRA